MISWRAKAKSWQGLNVETSGIMTMRIVADLKGAEARNLDLNDYMYTPWKIYFFQLRNICWSDLHLRLQGLEWRRLSPTAKWSPKPDGPVLGLDKKVWDLLNCQKIPETHRETPVKHIENTETHRNTSDRIKPKRIGWSFSPPRSAWWWWRKHRRVVHILSWGQDAPWLPLKDAGDIWWPLQGNCCLKKIKAIQVIFWVYPKHKTLFVNWWLCLLLWTEIILNQVCFDNRSPSVPWYKRFSGGLLHSWVAESIAIIRIEHVGSLGLGVQLFGAPKLMAFGGL